MPGRSPCTFLDRWRGHGGTQRSPGWYFLFFFVKAAYNQRVLSQKNVPVLIIFVSILLIPAVLILGMRTFIDEMPAFFQLRISPYKSLSYAMQNPQAQLISSEWNSYSKVDVVSSPSLHSVPGLSYQYLDPLPDIDALFVDGDNLSAILSPDADLHFAFYLPAALAYRLRPDAQTLILEPLAEWMSRPPKRWVQVR